MEDTIEYSQHNLQRNFQLWDQSPAQQDPGEVQPRDGHLGYLGTEEQDYERTKLAICRSDLTARSE
jgi:hypothetical protein